MLFATLWPTPSLNIPFHKGNGILPGSVQPFGLKRTCTRATYKVTTIVDPPDSTPQLFYRSAWKHRWLSTDYIHPWFKMVILSLWPGNCTNSIHRTPRSTHLKTLWTQNFFCFSQSNWKHEKITFRAPGQASYRKLYFPWGSFKHYPSSPLIATPGKGHYYMGQAISTLQDQHQIG